MRADELQKILDLHAKWTRGEPDGKTADLHGANLHGAGLGGANLHGANLGRADLDGVQVLQIGPIGSRRDYLVTCWGPDLDQVTTGCWTGTLDAFEQAIEKEHGADEHGVVYRAAIAMLRAMRVAAPVAERVS